METTDINVVSNSVCLDKVNCDINEDKKTISDESKMIGTDYSYKHQIVWPNLIGYLILHILGLWAAISLLTGAYNWKLILWSYFILFVGGEGITIGAHRYYTHRSFKAIPALRMMFIILQTLAGQNSMFVWVRDHRLHHRYSDTDADPHNSKRGFFFSHIGWLMTKKHPLVIKLGKTIDMSDLKADWMVMFQKKYYFELYFVISLLIPVYVPVYFFDETWMNSIMCCFFLRYIVLLNGTWSVNSLAHLYGTRPYDKKVQPVESWFVSFITQGEGWHNYHHAYPWDYKAAELSMHFNQSANIIRFFEKIGLAYDLKSVSDETVTNRINRTGDGTHFKLGNAEARASVTAIGPVHPFNPTFNTTLESPDVILKPEGLPLFSEKDKLNLHVLVRQTGH